tara:strand:- start:18183 stop:18728 length:546 start_codon:yes stop_codon:yes gene_type:complete
VVWLDNKENKNSKGSKMNKSILISLVIGSFLITGCAVKSEIKKVNESKSHFEDVIYTGQKDFYKSSEKLEGQKYRIFHQAASGFVATRALRNSAMKRALTFCKNINPTFNVTKISEHTGQPPYILGNFPKIEIIFICNDKIKEKVIIHNKYDDLKKIKDLYDNGTLTEDEYLQEKKKLLTK